MSAILFLPGPITLTCARNIPFPPGIQFPFRNCGLILFLWCTPMYEQLVVQMCSKAGFSPLVSKYVSSPNAFICNFDTGMEIFIADTYMRDSENQQLVRVPIQDMDSTMGFIYRKSNENPLVPYVCRQIMEAWEITK